MADQRSLSLSPAFIILNKTYEDNKSFFTKMSEPGKKLANKLYEGMYNIPGVDRVVGTLEIAYHQGWQKSYEKKQTELTEEKNNLAQKANLLGECLVEVEAEAIIQGNS